MFCLSTLRLWLTWVYARASPTINRPFLRSNSIQHRLHVFKHVTKTTQSLETRANSFYKCDKYRGIKYEDDIISCHGNSCHSTFWDWGVAVENMNCKKVYDNFVNLTIWTWMWERANLCIERCIDAVWKNNDAAIISTFFKMHWVNFLLKNIPMSWIYGKEYNFKAHSL